MKAERKYGFKRISAQIDTSAQVYECYCTIAVGSPCVLIAAPSHAELKKAFKALTGHEAKPLLFSKALFAEMGTKKQGGKK
ncbi:MAG: hypothetical protein KGJ90_06770 [Patescibacteria group bacterium]|nr:hypothetical protein [Patescibacteria group bacterium]